MVWGQWLEWKDLVGHSSGGGSQKKRAARRGRVALQETWGKIGHGPGGGRWWWVRDGGRRGRHRLATSMAAVAARRRIRRREEELHIGKRQGSETMVQAEEDGDWAGIVVGE